MAVQQAISVREAAKRYRVSTAKIREFIRRGLMPAVDVGLDGNHSWRITPEGLAAFDKTMTAVKPRKTRKAFVGTDAEIEAILNGAGDY